MRLCFDSICLSSPFHWKGTTTFATLLIKCSFSTYSLHSSSIDWLRKSKLKRYCMPFSTYCFISNCSVCKVSQIACIYPSFYPFLILRASALALFHNHCTLCWGGGQVCLSDRLPVLSHCLPTCGAGTFLHVRNNFCFHLACSAFHTRIVVVFTFRRAAETADIIHSIFLGHFDGFGDVEAFYDPVTSQSAAHRWQANRNWANRSRAECCQFAVFEEAKANFKCKCKSKCEKGGRRRKQIAIEVLRWTVN